MNTALPKRHRILSSLYTLTRRSSVAFTLHSQGIVKCSKTRTGETKGQSKVPQDFRFQSRILRKTLSSQIPIQVYLEAATPNTIYPKQSPESSHGTKSYVGSKLTSILPATVARSQKSTDAKRGKHLLVCPSDGKFYVPDYSASLP